MDVSEKSDALSNEEPKPLRFLEDLIGYRDDLPMERLVLNGILFFSFFAALFITVATYVFRLAFQTQMLGVAGTALVVFLLVQGRIGRMERQLPWAFFLLVLSICLYDFFMISGYSGLIIPLCIALVAIVPIIMPKGQARYAFLMMGSVPLIVGAALLLAPDQFIRWGQPVGLILYKVAEGALLGVGVAGSTLVLVHYYRIEQNKVLKLNQRLEDQNSLLRRKNEELQHAMDEIDTLREIIPICSHCKKVRNDDGYYEQVEDYLAKKTSVDFSHTICPECAKMYYPELMQDLKERGEILGDENA